MADYAKESPFPMPAYVTAPPHRTGTNVGTGAEHATRNKANWAVPGCATPPVLSDGDFWVRHYVKL